MDRWIAWILLAGFGFAAAATVANAHAALRHAVPAAGAVLSRAPEELQLEFSQAVDMAQVDLRLTSEGGAPIGLTEPEAQPASGTIVRRQINGRLKPGAYHVFWRVLSVDGHWTRGDYAFDIKGE